MSLKVHGHCEVGAAVVAVVKNGDFASTGKFAGNLDCVFNSLGSGIE
jgi:hypothetical protein